MDKSRISPTTGFDQAEVLEAMVVEDETRSHHDEIRDLVAVADFLTPELHRQAGAEDAAVVVTEWADGDPSLLEEAEATARRERHDESAVLLRRAVGLATAA